MDVLNLPKNIELEQNVLGSILIEKGTLPIVINHLTEDIFYDLRHQLVFRTIKAMYDKHIQVDLSTVFQKLVDDTIADFFLNHRFVKLHHLTQSIRSNQARCKPHPTFSFGTHSAVIDRK